MIVVKAPKVTTIMICLAPMMCFLTACGNKTPQTVSGFSKVMEDAGFEIQDLTDDTETKDLATSVIVAVGENYQIEFYELVDSETGKGVFYNNKQIFNDEHSFKTMSSEVTAGNYNYFSSMQKGIFT